MDQESLDEVAYTVRIYKIQETITCSRKIYYFATTFDEEVSVIWPQSWRKLGKWLYILTRYPVPFRILFTVLGFFPIGVPASLSACTVYNRGFWVMGITSITAAEATFWVCIYALLEGKLRYLVLLVLTFLGLTIPIQVFQGLYIMQERAVPLEELTVELRYACEIDSPSSFRFQTISTYISLSRTTLALLVATCTIIVRYRRQKNTLINVIRREGGFYYMSAFTLNFIGSLVRTPSIPFVDNYGVLNELKNLILVIFSGRLLLKMQQVNGLRTQAMVSTLMFDHSAHTSEDWDGSTEEGNTSTSPNLTVTGEPKGFEMEQCNGRGDVSEKTVLGTNAC
ncbi:hypothetical protein DFP72DRAFT_1101107 [Ephemerocybe angulata]|uniref:DUF6533 domain-containing protein n=1 Tax=Ephemerocybe angulata TaxID=980116 RepID=A0A8H6I650_9AGAR|nr:hypothetical protein DFP72DRAFT_1101107 [Tulosesus angulatus]